MHCFKANEDAGGCATETARKGFKAHLHHEGLMSMRAGLIVTGERSRNEKLDSAGMTRHHSESRGVAKAGTYT